MTTVIETMDDVDSVLFGRAMTCLRRFSVEAGPEECWLWTGALSNGYGMVRAYRFGARIQMSAHRFALIASGKRVPLGFDACHRCDVRNCVNPSHLFVGTRSDNMRDMMAKGRRGYVRGENNHCAKLSNADVIEIRRRVAAGQSQRAVARGFFVHNSYVSRVVRRLMRAEVA